MRKLLFNFSLLCLCLSSVFAQVAPSVGDGSEANPYEISTFGHLYWLSITNSAWDKHFIQTAHIDASVTKNWNAGKGWIPIALKSNFTGSYNGGFYNINNLFIARPDEEAFGVALFSKLSGARVEKVVLQNVSIEGYRFVGSIAGEAVLNSVISQCVVTGEISGHHEGVGGIAGRASSTLIDQCYSVATVQCESGSAGGFVGSFWTDSQLTNCYSTGKIRGKSYTGGIAGYANFSTGAIANNYFAGVLEQGGGGVIGYAYYGEQGVSNNFWDKEESGSTSSSGGEGVQGLTTEQMKTKSTYLNAGWDFVGDGTEEIWDISEDINKGYPHLPWVNGIKFIIPPEGEGTPESPFIIKTQDDLEWISENPNYWDRHFEQANPIEIENSDSWANGVNWQPIGSSSKPFTGTYNGNYHQIKNFYLNNPSISEQALFGRIKNATIKKVVLTDVDIVGEDFVSGIALYANESIISECLVTGTIKGESDIAVIVLEGNNTTIERCASHANITGYQAVGSIANSLFNESMLSDCYAAGTIKATQTAGGLVMSANLSTIQNSYFTGVLEVEKFHAGVIYSNTLSKVTNSFWNAELNPTVEDNGYGIAQNTLELKDINTYNKVLWSFKRSDSEGIWNMGAKNKGYPFLNWEFPDETPSSGTFLTVFAPLHGIARTDNSEVTVEGEILVVGNPAPTQHGICWSRHGIPTIDDDATEEGAISQTGNFTYTINELTPGNVYYIRAYSVVSDKVTYGDEYAVIIPTKPQGQGTTEEPYLISNIAELEWITHGPTALWERNFKQTNHIDASATMLTNGGQGWLPIATGSWFKGFYDGDFYEIQNLHINRPNDNNIGLFSRATEGTIKGVVLNNVQVIGKNLVGSIAGQVGWDNLAIKCAATGSVEGKEMVGGLFGSHSEGTVEQCFSQVNVKGHKTVGGLFGTLGDDSETYDSYSVGDVMSGSETGGLTGKGAYATLHNCYFAGSFPYRTVSIAGIGFGSDCTVSATFWDKEETKINSSPIGGSGRITADLKNVHFLVGAGWDFRDEGGIEDIWHMTADQNNGYPFLYWADGLLQPVSPEVNASELKAVGTTNATIVSRIFNVGNPTATQHGICWSTTPDPTTSDNKTEQGALKANGYFQSEITGLELNTTYYVRPYATNNEGTMYGNSLSFKTLDIFTLTYTATAGGSIQGESVQEVEEGQNGKPVTAIAAEGYQFEKWSDGSTDNPRIDKNVSKDISVIAEFAEDRTSVGSTDLEKAKLYPNPFTNMVSIADASGIKRILVTNILGQKLMIIPMEDKVSATVNTQHLNPGTYLFIFETTDNSRYVQRLIKE